MSIAVNKGPTYYNSLYRHGVDEKRRRPNPGQVAAGKAGHGTDTDALAEGERGSVFACFAAAAEMAKMVKAIDAMSNGDPNKVVLKRFIGSESVQVSVDKAGRICLPEGMARAAGIKDEAMLVGLLDRFEIWNPQSYRKKSRLPTPCWRTKPSKTDGVIMNLAKLLIAGKSIINGREAISYRASTNTFICPNLVWCKIHSSRRTRRNRRNRRNRKRKPSPPQSKKSSRPLRPRRKKYRRWPARPARATSWASKLNPISMWRGSTPAAPGAPCPVQSETFCWTA